MSPRASATLVGFTAILMWASVGTLVAVAGRLPAFETIALTLGLSGVLGCLGLAATGRLRELRQPVRVWALGVGGLFGYHALYFAALRLAPPVEAGLVNYLWPLLIVLLSGLLPGEHLRRHHVIGAGLGFLGAAAVVTGGRGVALDPSDAAGYAAAAAAAVTWAIYSVAARRLGEVPTSVVAGFCLVTGLFSVLCHFAFETWVSPVGAGGWAAVVALGIFPIGLGFLAWDHGMKRGDIQVLGAASYLTPILSTFLLIVAGVGSLTPAVTFAAVAVTLGALIASKDVFLRPKSPSSEPEPPSAT